MKNKKALALAISALLAGNIFFPSFATMAKSSSNSDSGETSANDAAMYYYLRRSAGGEMGNETGGIDSVIQGALSMFGGIPIGNNIKYTFSYNGLKAVVACMSTNQKPEAYSSATFTCYCHVPGGKCSFVDSSNPMALLSGAVGAGVGIKTVEFSEGGSKTESFTFRTEKMVCPNSEEAKKNEKGTVSSKTEDTKKDEGTTDKKDNPDLKPTKEAPCGFEITGDGEKKAIQKVPKYGMASASITASVYDGNSALDSNNITGGFQAATDGWQDPTGTGLDGSDPLPTDGVKTFSGGDPHALDGENPENLIDDSKYNLPSDSTSGSGSGINWNDAINRLLDDGDDSFNIADDDWSTSNGWDGEDDLSEYLNGVTDADGFESGGTIDDLLGLDEAFSEDGFNSSDDLDETVLFDTDGAGIADSDAGNVSEADRLNGADEMFNDVSDEQLLEMLRQQLSGGGSSNQLGLGSGSDSSALGLSQFANSLFGNDAQNIRNNTSSEQDLYDLARKYLAQMGFTDRDITHGKSYVKNSAWTEPDLAWDFNRITTLIKKKKIKTSNTSSNSNSSQRRTTNNRK